MGDAVRPETKVAFYKAVKFWLVFALAVFAAALVWRLLFVDPDGGARETTALPGQGRVSNMR